MNRGSTVMIREESWRFGNLHDNATIILNRLKHSGRIAFDCGRGLNRNSTVAESGSFLESLSHYECSQMLTNAYDASTIRYGASTIQAGSIMSIRKRSSTRGES